VRSRAHGSHYSSEGRYPLIPGVDAVARTADGALIYTGNVFAPYGTMAERMAISPRFHFELPAGTEHRAVLGEDSPSLVLDYVWGAPAETTFEALVRFEREEVEVDISYAQIGSLAGLNAALPSILLRSRRIKASAAASAR
jgi:hypothetical protein